MNELDGLVRQMHEVLVGAYNKGKKAGREECKPAMEKAYLDGWKKGVHEASFGSPCASCGEYKRGLKEVWDVVRRIESTPDEGGLTNKEIAEAFGKYYTSFDLYRTFTAEEAIEKLNAFDQKKKEEFQVGDVVWNSNNYRYAVILRIYGEDCIMVAEQGHGEPLMVHSPPRAALKKTDKVINVRNMLDLVEVTLKHEKPKAK